MLPIPITLSRLPRRDGPVPRPGAHRAHLPRAAGPSLQTRSGPAVSITAGRSSGVIEGGAGPPLHLDALRGPAAVTVLVGFEGSLEGVGGFAFALEVVREVVLASCTGQLLAFNPK